MRALIITAYKLIICVAPCATEVNLLYQKTNWRPFQTRPQVVRVGFTVQNSTRRNYLFFSKWVQRSLGTSSKQSYPSKVSSYMKSFVSCSYQRLSFIQFNIITIRCDKKRVQRNVRIFKEVFFRISIFCYQLFLKEIY